MTTNREKGASAEDVAVNFLAAKGYEILERNWYSQHHEIDIIARKDGIIAIVEVKSLASTYLREPFQAVSRNKQRMIISATNAYIRSKNVDDEVRFDIISIVMSQNDPVIEHIENAFYPTIR